MGPQTIKNPQQQEQQKPFKIKSFWKATPGQRLYT